jgi:hypothetical protein
VFPHASTADVVVRGLLVARLVLAPELQLVAPRRHGDRRRRAAVGERHLLGAEVQPVVHTPRR